MNRQLLTMTAAACLAAGALVAQTATPGGRGMGAGFQQAGMLGGNESGWQILPVQPARPGAATAVSGSPFSATEERKTVQTLGDGTVLERSDSNLLYRDNYGRTRTEQTRDGKTTVTISDPEGHFMAQIDPAARTARKITLVGGGIRIAPVAAPTAVAREAEERVAAAGAQAGRGDATLAAVALTLQQKMAAEKAAVEKMAAERGASTEAAANTTTEDLGVLTVNGVAAQGTRTTLTIPAGKIGNNRDIKVVNERWYSQELQMLVKSVNSDPRFGTTTYQLTNISRANPDAGLFQIPSDYTILEPGGRGGRGVLTPAK